MRSVLELNRLITEELMRFYAIRDEHEKTMDALYAEHFQAVVFETNLERKKEQEKEEATLSK